MRGWLSFSQQLLSASGLHQPLTSDTIILSVSFEIIYEEALGDILMNLVADPYYGSSAPRVGESEPSHIFSMIMLRISIMSGFQEVESTLPI